MSGATRRKRLAAMVVAVLVLLVALYLWAAHDVAVDAESASLVASMPLRPRSSGFAKLTAFAARVRRAEVATTRLPSSYDVDPSAADATLDTDFARVLPGAIEEILAPTPGAAAEANVNPQAAATTWTAANAAVRLLVLQMQRHLARKDDGAWQVGRLDLRFVRFLLNEARTFSELTSLELSCSELLRALSAAISAHRLTDQQLLELEDLAEWGGLAREVLDAMRGEYALFDDQLLQAKAQERGVLSGLSFQPNRTRRAWLAVMEGPVRALRLGNVADAHEALAAAPELSGRRPLIRNALGSSVVVMSIRGIVQASAQAVDLVAACGLVRAQAAMAHYHDKNSQWPADVADLRDGHGRPPPTDPWARNASFRYSRAEGRLYSLGRDRRDDHGLFQRDLFYGNGALDIGLRFSKE